MIRQAASEKAQASPGPRVPLLGFVIGREALVVALFSAATMIAGMLGNRLLTQFVSPGPLGEYYLYMNLAQWLTIPTAAGYLFVVRQWQSARSLGIARHFARTIWKGLGAQGVIAGAGSLLIGFLHLGGIGWLGALELFAIASLQGICQGFEPVQQMERRRVNAGVLALTGTPLRSFILMAGPLIWLSVTGERLLALQGVSSAILASATVVGLWLVLRNTEDSPHAKRLRDVSRHLSISSFLMFFAPSLVANVTTQGAASAERWGLARIASTSSTAIFVQAVALSMAVVAAATTVLSTYYYPLITGAAGAHDNAPLQAAMAPLRRYVLATALALGAATALFSEMGGIIAKVLFGPQYSQVADLLPWTMLGAASFQMAQTLAIVSITARNMIGKNAALLTSRIVYVVALLSVLPGPQSALRFSRLYAIGYLIYLGLMSAECVRLFLREKRTNPAPAAA